MTKEKTPPQDQKKKPLPKGFEQVSLQEYRAQHKKFVELRKKKIETSKATSKVVQVILILVAIPFFAIFLYWGYCMLIMARGAIAQ